MCENDVDVLVQKGFDVTDLLFTVFKFHGSQIHVKSFFFVSLFFGVFVRNWITVSENGKATG